VDILRVCKELGASNAVQVPTEKLVFQPETRVLCEQNTCGRFGANYTCPPFVGEVEGLIAKTKEFNAAVIWQNIYKLEDSYDFDGMMAGQMKHNNMTMEVAQKACLKHGRDNVLILSAGGCTICKECAAMRQTPCLYPDDALSSLEAYGMNVIESCLAIGMKYINGVNTVTYFSGAFFNSDLF